MNFYKDYNPEWNVLFHTTVSEMKSEKAVDNATFQKFKKSSKTVG